MTCKPERDYIEIYNSLFKEIVENPDGTLNKDQVMRELSDYTTFMNTASKVYMEITNGRISKVNTIADAIIGEYHAQLEAFAEELRDEFLEEMKRDTSDMKPVVGMYKLLGCPFCGQQPEAWKFESVVNVGCMNTKCKTRPSVRLMLEGLTENNDHPIHATIALWNEVFWKTPATDWGIRK